MTGLVFAVAAPSSLTLSEQGREHCKSCSTGWSPQKENGPFQNASGAHFEKHRLRTRSAVMSGGGLGAFASMVLQAIVQSKWQQRACYTNTASSQVPLPPLFLQLSAPTPSCKEILEMLLSMLRTQSPEVLECHFDRQVVISL